MGTKSSLTLKTVASPASQEKTIEMRSRALVVLARNAGEEGTRCGTQRGGEGNEVEVP
jgi:hypothetical protein